MALDSLEDIGPQTPDSQVMPKEVDVLKVDADLFFHGVGDGSLRDEIGDLGAPDTSTEYARLEVVRDVSKLAGTAAIMERYKVA